MHEGSGLENGYQSWLAELKKKIQRLILEEQERIIKETLDKLDSFYLDRHFAGECLAVATARKIVKGEKINIE
jgi:hypothetical protein